MKWTCCCFQIDLQTFLTLTDQDLKELGITTFGARRKMLLAISGRNEDENMPVFDLYFHIKTLCSRPSLQSAVRRSPKLTEHHPASCLLLLPFPQIGLCVSLRFPILSVATTSLSGAQLCRRNSGWHLRCQPLDSKAIGGPWYWQTGGKVQDSTVVANLSCKGKKNNLAAVICSSRSKWD